jgi:DNA phosphorothioation-dependent restriction protein DptG
MRFNIKEWQDKHLKEDKNDQLAIEFYTQSKNGKLLASKFNGKFKQNIFRNVLSTILDNTKRQEAVIRIWSEMLGLNHKKYTSGNIIEDIEFVKDATKSAELLYKLYQA